MNAALWQRTHMNSAQNVSPVRPALPFVLASLLYAGTLLGSRADETNTAAARADRDPTRERRRRRAIQRAAVRRLDSFGKTDFRTRTHSAHAAGREDQFTGSVDAGNAVTHRSKCDEPQRPPRVAARQRAV